MVFIFGYYTFPGIGKMCFTKGNDWTLNTFQRQVNLVAIYKGNIRNKTNSLSGFGKYYVLPTVTTEKSFCGMNWTIASILSKMKLTL